jgi:putative zinc finger/helix-turn-helix YgiT family protein
MHRKQGFIGPETSETGECPNCGSIEVTTNLEIESFVYGKGEGAVELSALVPVHTCSICKFRFADATADDEKHKAVCRHLGVLAPDEVARIRTRYGLTRSQFAEITRIGEASINRWETGQLIQNSGYDQLLYLLNFSANMDRLKERFSSKSETSEEMSTEVKMKFRNVVNIEDARRQARVFQLQPTGTTGK